MKKKQPEICEIRIQKKLWHVKIRTQKNLAGILRTENKPSKIAMENRCERDQAAQCKSVRKIEKTGKESIVKLFFSDSFPPSLSLSFSLFPLSAFTVLSPSFTYWSMLARLGEISFGSDREGKKKATFTFLWRCLFWKSDDGTKGERIWTKTKEKRWRKRERESKYDRAETTVVPKWIYK